MRNTRPAVLVSLVCAFPLFAACGGDSTPTNPGLPKPRLLSIPNAPGGTRTLIVMNLGPREEAISYRVTLTSPGSSPGEGLAGPRADATAHGRKRLAR